MVPMQEVGAAEGSFMSRREIHVIYFTLNSSERCDPSMKYLHIEHSSHIPNPESKRALEVRQTPIEPDSFLEHIALSRHMSPYLINTKKGTL
jgi:hypothetical protein